MTNIINQRDILLDWFLQNPGVGITGREIDSELGIMNYKARVSEVRALGYPIDRVWRKVKTRYGRTARIAVYSLPKDWNKAEAAPNE